MNPYQLLLMAAKTDPRMQEIVTKIQQGVNPESIFRDLCKQKGINPEEFIKSKDLDKF